MTTKNLKDWLAQVLEASIIAQNLKKYKPMIKCPFTDATGNVAKQKNSRVDCSLVEWIVTLPEVITLVIS